MVSLLGTSSSSILSCPRLSSTPLTSPLCFRPGNTFGGKLYRRIQSETKKSRSRHHVLVTNVATGINSIEQLFWGLLGKKEESARPVYPFAAIVGQDEMKLCLLLNVIDPKIGGVMIMGDRGTGKSTTVRSLVDLLPEITVVAGNPEEGELRPQLLDRFGMHAQVGTVRDAELRVKIVEERARFDSNPKEFRESYLEEQMKLQEQITSARSNLSGVEIDQDLKVKISRVCAELDVDGLRGDIVTNRAARALAALKGRDHVTAEDVGIVIPNCLRHRLRKDPLESMDSGIVVTEKFYEVFS
ncbi:hypothetical protein Bca4012_051724 [Brassica carinata]|uniref:magnesium chelatase n=1 Tax=Brassica carinata TaxID=52824 RepID=A0A8X7ULP3_BRACI|nr:hypothetical protein Bca52824_054269 [Brassica carinata]